MPEEFKDRTLCFRGIFVNGQNSATRNTSIIFEAVVETGVFIVSHKLFPSSSDTLTFEDFSTGLLKVVLTGFPSYQTTLLHIYIYDNAT